MLAIQLKCTHCSWITTCGDEQIISRLRQLGLLRRATHPSEEMLNELLLVNLLHLACDECGQLGLHLEEDSSEQLDWQQAVVCEICHQPIPWERLEIFPKSKRCVVCQDEADRGVAPEESEFCEKCGALVELRVSHSGGLTRYKRFCTGSPACRF